MYEIKLLLLVIWGVVEILVEKLLEEVWEKFVGNICVEMV